MRDDQRRLLESFVREERLDLVLAGLMAIQLDGERRTVDDGPTLPPAPVSGPSNPAIDEDEQKD